jgi:GDP/UDP-N,N'-diacetylbacillosamine 2-epimerase (hydrolysing)
MNANIPIAHLYGGETTEGAIDESIRHAITKLSHLHFTSTLEYRKRVIQLGEAPDRVFCVGALGIENIRNTKLLSKEELRLDTGIDAEKPYAMVTFHPITLEINSAQKQFKNLLMALEKHKEYEYIFTKANADTDGRLINQMIDEYTAVHGNSKGFASLGMLRYLSALKYASMVIGNSSSGLLEAPSFGIPTINIGDRQKGRLQSTSVINCQPEVNAIAGAVVLAGSQEFKRLAENTVNPYGDGNTSEKIIEVIKEFITGEKVNLKKQFYNIDFTV